jgi:uncharacterized protein (DUF362 family)
MGSDLVAVDSTCCRIMGLDPQGLQYLRLTAERGHLHAERIEQRAESVASVRIDYNLIDSFRAFHLKAWP